MRHDTDEEHESIPRPPWPFRLLVLGLGLLAAVLLPASLEAVARNPLQALGWVVLVSMASYRALRVLPHHAVDVTLRTPVVVGAAILIGPQLTLAVALVALISEEELARRHSPWMIAFNHLQSGLAAYACALAGAALPLGAVGGALVAVPVYLGCSLLAISVGNWLLGRMPLRVAAQRAAAPYPWFGRTFLLSALLCVLVVVLHEQAGVWSLGLLLIPLWLGFTALRMAQQASERAEELTARVRDLEVVSELGPALLSARRVSAVTALGRRALEDICQDDVDPDDIVVALDGELPPHLVPRPVPGTVALVGLPADLDERRSAAAATVCTAIGLALQRLAVEQELREAQRAQAALAEQILAEGAIARSRVALHVHDDVLPFLAAAQIQADNTLSAAACGNEALMIRLATRVRDAVESGIRTLRDVLDDLRGQTLLSGDLLDWLRETAERTRIEHGMAVEVHAERFRSDLPHATEILLAETVTGLLSNVVRHAHASTVRIGLTSHATWTVLEVSDDGVGFDPAGVGEEHHGLALLRQRTALVDGRLTIDSRAGRGTTVLLHVPTGSQAETPARVPPPGTGATVTAAKPLPRPIAV